MSFNVDHSQTTVSERREAEFIILFVLFREPAAPIDTYFRPNTYLVVLAPPL